MASMLKLIFLNTLTMAEPFFDDEEIRDIVNRHLMYNMTGN